MFPDAPPLQSILQQFASQLQDATLLLKHARITAALKPLLPEDLYQRGLKQLHENRLLEAKLYFEAAAAKQYPPAYIQLHRLSILGIVEMPNDVQAAQWKQNIIAAKDWLIQQTSNPSISADTHCNLAWCYWHGIGVIKDRQETMRRYKIVVDAGNPSAIAQVGLGWCLANSDNLNRQETIAAVYRLYKAASDQEDALAPYYLAEHGVKTAVGIPENFQKIAEWYLLAANRGNLAAQYKLARCHVFGEGVAKDLKKAEFWYHKAATKGYPLAQYNLGCYYQSTKNILKAMMWFHVLAEQKDARGYFSLAHCYEKGGHGVAVDIPKAIELYQTAIALYEAVIARDGISAQLSIGECYEKLGSIDIARREEWCLKAVDIYRPLAEQGNTQSQYNLGRCYEAIARIVEDRNTWYTAAVVWYQKAAEKGYAKAETALGRCIATGISSSTSGGINDLKDMLAIVWYMKAAAHGDADAQFQMGLYLEAGKPGLLPNLEQAKNCYESAAIKGNPEAQVAVAKCYWKGRGVTPNLDAAIRWCRKAVAQNYVPAKKLLPQLTHFTAGQLLWNEWYSRPPLPLQPKDIKATLWYKAQAEKGNVEAQFTFAKRCFEGIGIKRDINLATEWCAKASSAGHQSANELLIFLSNTKKTLKK